MPSTDENMNSGGSRILVHSSSPGSVRVLSLVTKSEAPESWEWSPGTPSSVSPIWAVWLAFGGTPGVEVSAREIRFSSLPPMVTMGAPEAASGGGVCFLGDFFLLGNLRAAGWENVMCCCLSKNSF